jgi:hypothetical protein
MSTVIATRERPRIVSRETIELFESNNPALKGIGAIMVDLGVWVVENGEKTATRDIASMPGLHARSDTRGSTYVSSLIDVEV